MKFIKIVLVIIVLSAIGGLVLWQVYKKQIISQSIQDAVSKGTGNLYYIHYDSSDIDEVDGNASFFNVVLQSDSLQEQLRTFDSASRNTIYNVRIDEVTVKGANIKALRSNTAVDAALVKIIHPVVYIIQSGTGTEKKLDSNDSLAIYEKLLGKFKSIHAKEIQVERGQLYFADKTGDPRTSLKDISIHLNNFSIDNSKDYKNVVSYFINDVVAKVNEIEVKGEKNKAVFTELEYNAPGKFLKVKKFQQHNKENQLVFDVSNTALNNIATDSFILNQQLRADELTSDGGLLTFYRKGHQQKDAANDEIEIDNNYFDEAILNKITIGKTNIVIYNRATPAAEPVLVKNARFSATDIQSLHSGTSIRNLIGTSKWVLSADGLSTMQAGNLYKINVGPFVLNSEQSTMSLQSFSVTPVVSEATFSKTHQYQEDLYNLAFKNIRLTGINTKLLVSDKSLDASTMQFEPVIKIYNDRTALPGKESKVGGYPHQLLQQLKLPVSIKNVEVRNGYLAYTEKSIVSGKTGTVFFKNINATINNVTNQKAAINRNNIMELNATTSFMGVSDIRTNWKLPLNSNNGAFEVSGEAGGFDGPSLNKMTVPMAMVAIRKGHFTKISFKMNGDDHGAKGRSTILYEDLKLDVLRKDSNDTKKRGVVSFIANFMVLNNNPQNGNTREGTINQDREVTKSFFNLIWKSVFDAAKRTVSGKKE